MPAQDNPQYWRTLYRPPAKRSTQGDASQGVLADGDLDAELPDDPLDATAMELGIDLPRLSALVERLIAKRLAGMSTTGGPIPETSPTPDTEEDGAEDWSAGMFGFDAEDTSAQGLGDDFDLMNLSSEPDEVIVAVIDDDSDFELAAVAGDGFFQLGMDDEQDFSSPARQPRPMAEPVVEHELVERLQAAKFVRLRWEPGGMGNLQPPEVVPRSDGVGLVLPAHAGRPPPPSTMVALEIAGEDGYFQARTPVLSVKGSDEGWSSAGTLVVLAVPKDLEVTNSRRNARHQVTVQTRACLLRRGAQGKLQTAGDIFPCRIDEISAGGCSISSQYTIPTGTLLAVQLPVDGGALPLYCEVLRSSPAGGSGKPGRCGIQFVDLPAGVAQQLQIWLEAL